MSLIVLSPLELAIADAGQDDGEPLVYFFVYASRYEGETYYSVSSLPPRWSDIRGCFGVTLMAGPFSQIEDARQARNRALFLNFFTE